MTVQESFPCFGVPTLFADMSPSLRMHHFDVPVQGAPSIRSIVALFAEVVFDLLVHRLDVFLHVAGGICRVWTRNAIGLPTRGI